MIKNIMFNLSIYLLRNENLDENDLINLAIGSLNGSLTLDEIKILECIRKNTHITVELLSKETNISIGKIYRIYKVLNEKGYIERNGTRNKGCWKILK